MAYKDNKDVAFYLIYVSEAHPVRQPTLAPGEKPTGPSDIGQAKTLDDRVLAASACMEGLHLTLPVLIDTMDGAAAKAYRGVPAATAVINREGNVLFHSTGPGGCRPREAQRALEALGLHPGPPTTKPTTRPSTRPAARASARP